MWSRTQIMSPKRRMTWCGTQDTTSFSCVMEVKVLPHFPEKCSQNSVNITEKTFNHVSDTQKEEYLIIYFKGWQHFEICLRFTCFTGTKLLEKCIRNIWTQVKEFHVPTEPNHWGAWTQDIAKALHMSLTHREDHLSTEMTKAKTKVSCWIILWIFML